MDDFDALGWATRLQHFAEEKQSGSPVVPPIYQNSLFVFDKVDELWHLPQEDPFGPPFHYSRISNPTLDTVERKLASLEGAERAKVYGSGMGAISSAIMACVESGSHVVALDTCYGPTKQLLNDYLPRFGVKTTFVHGMTPESILDAIRPETTCIYLESPSSIVFRLQDIRKVTSVAREKGIATIFDNSYSSPYYQNPIAMGIDIVVHSASKYLGGHSDITAGVLCTSSDRLARIVTLETALFGAAMAPFPAWLLLRGLRTLEIRMQRAQMVGNAIAEFLKTCPEVERINHVGDPDSSQRDLFQSQMRGSSSLLSFEPKNQDIEAVKRFVEGLDLFQIGVSWGGFESLCVPIWYHPLDWDQPRWVIRLYAGLEDPKDLMTDIRQSFDKMG